MKDSQQQPLIDWDLNKYSKAAPGVVTALIALGKAVDDAGLGKPLTELIKIRVSQINGCAFCLQYHLQIIRKHDIDPVKLDMVATWREAGIYSDKEQAALAWAEALTHLPATEDADAIYVQLQTLFSETEIAFLTAAIGNINAWNRIAGGLRFTPPYATS